MRLNRHTLEMAVALAIVAAIARMHGGHAFAESADGVTRVGLVLLDNEGTARSS